MIVVQAALLEVRNHVEDRIREAADVQDVRALPGLGGPVGLEIQADQPRLPAPVLEPVRFPEQGRAAAVARMAMPAQGGRITRDGVDEEIERLRAMWREPSEGASESRWVDRQLGPRRAEGLDHFDRVQLEEVLAVCARTRSLSEAGRLLFTASRIQKRKANDSGRLRKYLARFDLSLEDVHEHPPL